jgi:hypothetical protein
MVDDVIQIAMKRAAAQYSIEARFGGLRPGHRAAAIYAELRKLDAGIGSVALSEPQRVICRHDVGPYRPLTETPNEWVAGSAAFPATRTHCAEPPHRVGAADRHEVGVAG